MTDEKPDVAKTYDAIEQVATIQGLVPRLPSVSADIEARKHEAYGETCYCSDGAHKYLRYQQRKKIEVVLASFKQHQDTLRAQADAFRGMKESHFQECAKHFGIACEQIRQGMYELEQAAIELEKNE